MHSLLVLKDIEVTFLLNTYSSTLSKLNFIKQAQNS
jgi:hypothetical protein